MGSRTLAAASEVAYSPRWARFVTGSLLAASLAFAGAVPATLAQDDEAQVRVVHASPDAPAVDIFVGGERAIEGLEFGTATDLVSLPAGDTEVAVAPAGASEEDAVIAATLPLEAGAAYEVAAVGTLENIEAQVYPIDTGALEDGQARVRVVHASPDAGPVDVAVAGGDVLFGGLEFPNASDYAEVDAGTYDLEVRAAGTDTVALPLPGVTFEAGTVYDVFAVGLAEDGTLTVLPLTAPAEGVGGGTAAASGGQLPAADAQAAAPAEQGRGGGGRDRAAAGGMQQMPSVGVGSAVGTDGGSSAWLLAAAALAASLALGFAVRERVGRAGR